MAKTVLMGDDAAFMRMMIKDILSKNGYTVVGEAENGLVAVEIQGVEAGSGNYGYNYAGNGWNYSSERNS